MCQGQDYRQAVAAVKEALADRFTSSHSPDGAWLIFTPGVSLTAEYGWKVHIASSVEGWPLLWQNLGPVLREFALPFKVAADFDTFCQLNAGLLGASQIGKNVVIYSVIEMVTRQLMRQLRSFCQDPAAPKIPSDYYFSDTDSVGFRYCEIAPTTVSYGFDGQSRFVRQSSSSEPWQDDRQGSLPPGINLWELDGLAATQAVTDDQNLAEALGLFTGNAGVALALATAQQYAGDKRYLQAIARRMSAAAQAVDADLFSGKAGVVYAGLLVDRLTGLSLARPIIEMLASDLKRDVVSYDGLLGLANAHRHQVDELPSLGASHGSAGIAMALFSCGDTYGDDHAKDLAVLAFKQLLTLGRCRFGRHLRHDVHPDSRSTPTGHWCHGVAGVLWAILMSCGDEPELRDEIDWAAERFFAEPIVGNTTVCHGLAGQLELAGMLRKLPRFAAKAQIRSELLRSYLLYAQAVGPDGCLWPAENPSVVTPDLWVGAMGPAAVLALSQHKEYRPLLSLEALEFT